MVNETVKVVLADDHPIVRGGIKTLLESDSSLEVIAEASSGEEALNLVFKMNPNILVTDISMSGLNGIELAQAIADNGGDTKVLILSVHEDHQYIMKGYEAGALGYLPKNSSETELINAIKTINTGQKHLTHSVSQILAQSLIIQQAQPKKDYNLTTREKEVLKMLIDGMSNKQIAADLFISIRTVDTHRTNIMKKLDVNNTAELVRVGLYENLVE